jgi:peptide/nickel transport system substrate-binding protein
MRVNRTIASVFACSLAIAGLAGCSSSSSSGSGGTKAAALTIGMPDGPMTDNNNPYLNSSAAAQLGYRYMIYEPVAMVNQAEPAQAAQPWLATAWSWADNYHSITLTARTGVTFSDGTPMTAADIAYSFQIMKQYSALNTYALDITAVTTSGDNVTVDFGSSQFVHQDDVLSTFVVPKHIWSAMSNPTTDTVADPVGTGPYTLTSFTPQTTTLTVRKSYWQALPKVQKLLYTSYTANDAQTTALASGATQWSYVFIPNVQEVFQAKDPAHFKIWFPPTLSADGLWINTTVAPFNNVALRKAMSMVIDRGDIFTQGESGYFKPEITSVTGLPTPAGNTFITPQFQGQNASVNVAAAKAVLTAAGFTYSGSTLKAPDGKPVTITLTDPAGWSDYQTDLSIISDNFAQIGITATIDKADQNAWTTAFAAGDFQASMHWSNGGATPYDMYENIMDGADLLPVGNAKAVGNYGRFNDPAATAALNAYADAASATARTAALNTLEQIMVNEVPMIPTSAGNVGAEYSTRDWVGWPSDANPYAGIQPTTVGALDVVLHLTPAK